MKNNKGYSFISIPLLIIGMALVGYYIVQNAKTDNNLTGQAIKSTPENTSPQSPGTTGTVNQAPAPNPGLPPTVANPCYKSGTNIVVHDIWNRKADLGGATFGAARGNAAGFFIGLKGYIGTGWNGTTALSDLWEWDQSADIWTQKAPFPGTSRWGAVGFSIGTKGYVGTGYNSSIAGLYSDFYEYDQTTNTWTQKASFPGLRAYATGFSIGTKGYVGTGWDGVQKNDFWEYTPGPGVMGGTWTQKALFPGSARSGATGFSIGTKGYIGTGWNFNSLSETNDFYEYDQATNTWLQKANFSGTKRKMASGFSIGTKGYIGTGDYNGTPQNDFYEYNPSTNVWTPRANFGGTARDASVGFSVGGRGYIGTGIDNAVTKDYWEYCP